MNNIGVFIAKFNNGFRVTLASNFSRDSSLRWVHEIKEFFCDSELHETEDEVLKAAFKKLKQLNDLIPINCGIQWVGEFDFEF